MNIWQQTTLVLGGKPRMPALPVESARVLPEPIPFVMETRHSGIGTSTQPDPAALLREALGWAAIAIGAISDRVASLAQTIEVCRRRRVNGKLILEPIDDHPLAMILHKGSPVHPPSVLFRTMASHILTVGEAYLFKVRGRGIPMPVELWLGQPATIRPLVASGLIIGVEVYDGTGARWEIDSSEYVRAFWADPESIYTSEGKLGPQAIAVDAKKFSDQTMREHFEHNAIPRVIMEANENAAIGSLGDESIDRLNDAMRKRFSRLKGKDRGLPFWAPSGFKAHELSAMGGVDELGGLSDSWRDQILAAFGVPKSVLGLTDESGLGRATAETNQYVMDVRAVKPVADLIAEALTTQCAMSDFGPDFVVRFPDFAPADKLYELQRDESRLKMKLATINQLRKRDGESSVAWGDLPVGSIGEAPYTGEEREMIGSDLPGSLGEDDDEEPDDEPRADTTRRQRDSLPQAVRVAVGVRESGGARTPTRATLTREQQIDQAAWVRFVARERKFVPRAEKIMRGIFGIQERQVIKALREGGLGRSSRITDQEALAILRNTLGEARWLALFKSRFEPLRQLAFIEAGQDALALVGGSPEAFVLSQRTAEILLTQGDEFRRLVTSTTIKAASDAVIRALAEGAAAGESASQRAKRIEAAVGDAMTGRRRQALTIARTEMLTATQRAQVEGFRESGVVAAKRWGTSRDDAVRDSHQIDGQTRLLDEAFLLPAAGKSPAEGAMAPGVGEGGRRLSAGNTINCRCFVRPVVEVKT